MLLEVHIRPDMVYVRIFMGYAGPKSYGLCVLAGLWVISPIPSREHQKVMCYKGLWVMRGMGYEGVDCIGSGPSPHITIRKP